MSTLRVVVRCRTGRPRARARPARARIDVTVHEVDPSLTARPQGYRLHLNDHGLVAIAEVLTPAQQAELDATAGRLDPPAVRLTIPLSTPSLPETTGQHGAVDRLTLRRILDTGLEDVDTFGHGWSATKPAGAEVLIGAEDS